MKASERIASEKNNYVRIGLEASAVVAAELGMPDAEISDEVYGRLLLVAEKAEQLGLTEQELAGRLSEYAHEFVQEKQEDERPTLPPLVDTDEASDTYITYWLQRESDEHMRAALIGALESAGNVAMSQHAYALVSSVVRLAKAMGKTPDQVRDTLFAQSAHALASLPRKPVGPAADATWLRPEDTVNHRDYMIMLLGAQAIVGALATAPAPFEPDRHNCLRLQGALQDAIMIIETSSDPSTMTVGNLSSAAVLSAIGDLLA